MEREQGKLIARRIAKAIAAVVSGPGFNETELGIAWNEASDEFRQQTVDDLANVALNVMEAAKVYDKEGGLPDLLREIAEHRTWNVLLAAVMSAWSQAEGTGETPTIGPYASALTDCGCDDPGACDWCCGTAKLTRMAKAAKDDAERTGVLPVPLPEREIKEGDIPREPADLEIARALSHQWPFVEGMRRLGANRVEVRRTGGPSIRVDFHIGQDGTVRDAGDRLVKCDCGAVMSLYSYRGDGEPAEWKCPSCQKVVKR